LKVVFDNDCVSISKRPSSILIESVEDIFLNVVLNSPEKILLLEIIVSILLINKYPEFGKE
jgi:hypothetical protein